MIGFCGVMTMAGGNIINSLLGVDKTWGIVIITLISISIAVFGGLKSSMISDLLQFSLFVILLPILGIISIYKANISIDTFYMSASNLTQIGFNEISSITIIGLLVTWFFGEMLVPPTISCILSSKDSGIAKRALIYSGFFMILWLFVMLTISIISKMSGIINSNADSVLFQLGSNFLPNGLLGFFLTALLGVIITTQDSLINSASVIFSIDIFNIIKEGDSKRNLIISRLAGIFVGLIAIVFAIKTPTILEGLANIYSFWAPTILVALLTSIFLKKVYWQSVLLSMIIGGSSSLFAKYCSIGIPSIIVGIIISLIVYFSVHYYLKATHSRKDI
jgi:SSS family solute:Na+ symporter